MCGRMRSRRLRRRREAQSRRGGETAYRREVIAACSKVLLVALSGHFASSRFIRREHSVRHYGGHFWASDLGVCGIIPDS